MFVLEALWKWLVVAGRMRLGDADRIQSSDDSEHSKGAYTVNQSQDHVGYAQGTNDWHIFTLLMTLVGHWRSISVWRSAWYCLRSLTDIWSPCGCAAGRHALPLSRWNCPPLDHSRFLVSMVRVTGPSLMRATFMSAPNSPEETGLPRFCSRVFRNAS